MGSKKSKKAPTNPPYASEKQVKQRVKGLSRLIAQAERAEKALNNISAKLKKWGINCVNASDVSLELRRAHAEGFTPPRAANKPQFKEGDAVMIKSEYVPEVLEMFGFTEQNLHDLRVRMIVGQKRDRKIVIENNEADRMPLPARYLVKA